MNTDFAAFVTFTFWVRTLRTRWYAWSRACLCRSSLQAPACRLLASRQTPAQMHHQARPTAVSRITEELA